MTNNDHSSLEAVKALSQAIARVDDPQRIFDLIYMYPETAFLSTAKGAGAQIANGLGMLLQQGARAFTIWTGIEPDIGAMRKALEKAVYS